MEGLEVSEIKLSELTDDNDVLRIDAEYFGKKILTAIKQLQNSGAIPLIKLSSITDGIHTSLPFIENGPVRVLSAKHPKENYIARSHFETISAEYHAENPRTALRANDVLLSTVGTIGNSAVVTEDLLPANSDRHIGIIRVTDSSLSPHFLSTVLISRYGRMQSVRETTGNVQPNLFISKIGRLLIPRFSKILESVISGTVRNAYAMREQSSTYLKNSEISLLRALRMEGWQAPEPLSYIRQSSEAFAAERFDAEYFHPQKASALAALKTASDVKVGDLFSSVRQLWQPDDGLPADLVRNYDLNDALAPFLDGEKPPVPRAQIASTKKILQAGDLVVSRLRSYLREIAVVEPSTDYPMVASTEYIVLRPREGMLLPVEALLVYLRSELPQIVLKWSQDGSNHPRFDEKEILRMPVPRALIANPMPYVEAMQAMKSEKQRATQLLDAAKRAVEIAIEDSEAAALAYLGQVAPPEH